MASFRTFGAIFLLNLLINLPIFVKSSTIQRSLSDDIRNGIGIAGKILGKIVNSMNLTFCRKKFNIFLMFRH